MYEKIWKSRKNEVNLSAAGRDVVGDGTHKTKMKFTFVPYYIISIHYLRVNCTFLGAR